MANTPEIEYIEATIPLPQYSAIMDTKKKKVAAYARVSTEQDEQQSSYEAQVDYYTQHIRNHDDWEFAGIYSDEGITGTSTKKREGFNRMIEDALSGKIDLILTKSISRFARNTVDTLQTVRKLKSAGIEVYFEKENLHTFDPKCEMMLTIMSSLAQEESRSISENVRWGHRKSMRDGKVHLAYSRFLGYKKGEDGRPEIVEEEATIVREIYGLFLDGKSIRNIADTLTARGIPTPAGKSQWSVSTIKSILSNEKYKGEALLQKTYTVDYLTKEVRKNNGEVPSVRVKNSHEAIIDPETFDRVQEMLEQRKKAKAKVKGNHPFTGKLICGECGSYYGRKVWRVRSTGERYNVWYCNHKYDGETCNTQRLREDEVEDLFMRMQERRGESDTSYSPERWLNLVEHIIICANGTARILLTSGEEMELSIHAHG